MYICTVCATCTAQDVIVRQRGLHCALTELYNQLSQLELGLGTLAVSSYKESRSNKPIYGYMLPNMSPSPNTYNVQSVYNNNVALCSLHEFSDIHVSLAVAT